MSAFIAGQRWLSHSEPELGIGIVVGHEGRIVKLLFPASREQRIYSGNSAPLSRVQFSAGDAIEDCDGNHWTVIGLDQQEGLIQYQVRNEEGLEQPLSERDLADHLQLNSAADRLLTGQLSTNKQFLLRYLALQQRQSLQQSPVAGLTGGRMSLIPHQLHIARQVSQRHAPRVLLADEVGLGKTIEAGLIIHSQLLSGRAKRVLILVPESLQHQWLVEMRRRFNLKFSLYDEERCYTVGGNPFLHEQLVLCALPLLSEDAALANAAIAAPWDLLVVDEAHHLSWSPDAVSPQYQLVEQLAQKIPGVLLLTATPEQLGRASHFARLRLLDSHRFESLDRFIAEEQDYEPLMDSIQHLLDASPLSDADLLRLGAKLGHQDSKPLAVLANDDSSPEQCAEARQQLVNALIDRHGTGRLLFRNSRRHVQGFPKRDVRPVELPAVSLYAPAKQLNEALYPERAFQKLASRSSDWWLIDPRVSWLLTLTQQLAGEKILLICAADQTAIDLEQFFRSQNSLRCALFHGQMSLMQRDREAAYFAQTEQGAQILLCSEIGSEGRNFQFAHHLVLFDLPGTPDLLEQRIGRLDRIGQTQDVILHLPYLAQSAGERLFRWYHQGLNALNEQCPAGMVVQTELQSELHDWLLNLDIEDAALLQQASERRDQLNLELQRGRDRLLELNSSGEQHSAALIEQIQAEDDSHDREDLMEQIWDLYGVDSEELSDRSLLLRPSEHLLISHFPGLDEDGTQVTFDRATAIAREDLEFLSWEHPMVADSLDMLLSSELGNTAVSFWKDSGLPAGQVMLEALFVLSTTAPAKLQLQRFLPSRCLRVLISQSGANLTDKISHDQLSARVQGLKKATAVELIRSRSSELRTLVQKLPKLVKPLAEAEIQQASELLLQQVGDEVKRMVALKERNPNVRDDEINHLKLTLLEGHTAIADAQWRLDALRLVFIA